MRKWQGQPGQCLFCLFRQSQRSSITTKSFQRPASILAASKRTERSPRAAPRWSDEGLGRTRIRQRKGEEKDVPRGSPAQSDRSRFSIHRSRLDNPRRRFDKENKPPPDKPKRLKTVLTLVEQQLKTIQQVQESSSEPAVQAIALDSQQWQTFKEEVSSIYDDLSPEAPKYLRKIRYDLDRLLPANGYASATARYIYGAYLDKSFDGLDLNPNKALAQVADLRYPSEWFPVARTIQRTIHLHIGPTNSGKTYAALKRLEEAQNGFYAGPLRLLAHEVYSRFNAKGMACDLVTGDDVRIGDVRADKTASTVEMVDTASLLEVGVIDEIQMIADESRGWAWTRAVLGSRVKELHLCGETRVLPLIQQLAAMSGDKLQVHTYQRLNPLKVMSRSLRGNFNNLRKGDAIVSFSVMQIHALKKQIEAKTNRRVAIVYGSLPPETRAQQAALFNDPDNDYDYLVASDAIGMGLNLSIKRIVFETVQKFDGVNTVQLEVSQIKQIAGRAGRFRTAHDDLKHKTDSSKPRQTADNLVGLVTCFEEEDLPIIEQAMKVEAPPLRTAYIIPPADFVVEYASRLPVGVTFDYTMSRLCRAATTHHLFSLGKIDDNLELGRIIDPVSGLTTAQRCMISACPVSVRKGNIFAEKLLRALATIIAERREVTIVDVPEVPLEVLEERVVPDDAYLARLEQLHKAIIVYLWLSYRFNSVLLDQDMAFHAKEMAEVRINDFLSRFSKTRDQFGPRANKAKTRRPDIAQVRQVAPTESERIKGYSAHGDISDDMRFVEDGEISSQELADGVGEHREKPGSSAAQEYVHEPSDETQYYRAEDNVVVDGENGAAAASPVSTSFEATEQEVQDKSTAKSLIDGPSQPILPGHRVYKTDVNMYL